MLTNHKAAAIIAQVADEHCLTPAVITGRSRQRLHCAARREAWRRMVAIGSSLADAGRATGHDHTTVLHGLRRLTHDAGLG